MKTITSLQNTNIKNVVRLRTARARKSCQLTLVEGYSEVLRALEAKVAFKEVYICKKYLNKYDSSEALVKRFSLLQTEMFEIPEDVYLKISYGDRKEGVVAVCKTEYLKLGDLCLRQNPFLVVLEGIEKPGNLGAIFRTCDGAGVDGIILCDGCSDVYNPNVIRASIATVFSVKFVLASNEEAQQFIKSKGIMAYAAFPDAKDIYYKKNFQNASAVIFGNEHSGLSDFWRQKADAKVCIPMNGIADSLNVSSSAAVLIYEMLRQKSKK